MLSSMEPQEKEKGFGWEYELFRIFFSFFFSKKSQVKGSTLSCSQKFNLRTIKEKSGTVFGKTLTSFEILTALQLCIAFFFFLHGDSGWGVASFTSPFGTSKL